MLTFAVYHDELPLAEWPDAVNTLAYACYLADEDDRPQERAFDFDFGRVIGYCPTGVRRRLYIRYAVRGFGDPVLRTRLLTSDETLRTLALELALGRVELLDAAWADAERDGISLPDTLTRAREEATALTRQAVACDAEGRHAVASRMADDALAISVPLGEQVALAVAEARLQRRQQAGGCADLLFGCAGLGDAKALTESHPVGQWFLRAFNYATLPFYLSRVEPEPGCVDLDTQLHSARALHARGFRLKGHPLIWLYTACLPPHRRAIDFATCCRVFAERIRRDVPPFAGLIEYWDIINEAHTLAWANPMGFSPEQLVELTRIAAATTREVAPQSKLVVNICLPFGEYVAGAPGRVTALEYLQACVEAGVDFDIIGIQFYYGSGMLQYCWDMLEISRILDAYVAFGKEIHITELGTPSAMGPDAHAYLKQGNEVGFWHEGWSQATQADWVEQFYRICLSKPDITALTWWSFTDTRPFWPHGGLLDADNQPKAAYHRLLALRDELVP